MSRREKRNISIPISSFETIAERTKSSHKRQSKPPQRFDFEDRCFPRQKVKREKTSIESNDYNSDQYSNQYHFDSDLKPKTKQYKKRGRPRKLIQNTIKNELLSPERSAPILNPYIGFHDNNESNRLSNGYHIFGAKVSTSTPKSIGDMKSEALNKQSIHRLISNKGNKCVISSPPKLFPVDESETEIDIDDIPEPPTLQSVYQPVLQPVQTVNGFPGNPRMDFKNKKLFSNDSQNNINDKKLLEFELMKTNRELEQMRKRYALNVAEVQTLKDDNINLIENIKKFNEENRRLKKKLFDDSISFKTEILEVKRKHWCSVCLREAVYYCCWVGSYCSNECQKIHWKQSHKNICRRDHN